MNEFCTHIIKIRVSKVVKNQAITIGLNLLPWEYQNLPRSTKKPAKMGCFVWQGKIVSEPPLMREKNTRKARKGGIISKW